MATRDLTKGSPLINLIIFSLPLIAGTIFQQFYNFADTIMIGRLISSEALGAAGVTYPLNFLILGFIQGFTIGLGIPLSHAVGAKDKEEFSKLFFNALYISVFISILLTFATLIFSKQLLLLIRTPRQILESANSYITIIFAGIPFTVIYNFSTSALRANGDSKHPFYFLILANVLNIAFDYIFIKTFNMGIKGAASATVLCQFISAVLNMAYLLIKTKAISFNKKYISLSKIHTMVLYKNAVPMGLEYSFSSIGAIVMQGAINSFGTPYITGQTAGEKIRQMFTLPMESVGMAQAVYTGQNWGAKNYERIKQGIKSGLIIQSIYCIICYFVIYLLKAPLTSVVLGSQITKTHTISVAYLATISMFFIFHGSLMIFRNTLQGMGYSVQALFSGVCELTGRSIGAFIALYCIGFTGIALANPFAWMLALLYCSVMTIHYLVEAKKKQNDTL